MLKEGVYVYDGEDKDVYFIVTVKETEHAIKMKMVENSSWFTPNHFDMMFHGGKTISIRKEKSPHAINFSGDDWFCIYPGIAGIPYPFRFVEPIQSQHIVFDEKNQGKLLDIPV